MIEVNDLSLPEAADRYAEAGYRVFRLLPGGKTPFRRSRGFKDATNDRAQIERLWTEKPDANIGVRTGPGFADVLDVDVKRGAPGMSSLLAARRRGLISGSFAVASTPSNGLHWLWAPSGLGNHTRARIGLDVRGDGGYVVAPPSVTDVGRYRWQRFEPERYGPPLPWPQIIDLLDPPRPARDVRGAPDIDALADWLAAQTEGNRNAGLHWAACRVAEAGGDPGALASTARAIGLLDREIRATIASARRQVAR